MVMHKLTKCPMRGPPRENHAIGGGGEALFEIEGGGPEEHPTTLMTASTLLTPNISSAKKASSLYRHYAKLKYAKAARPATNKSFIT